MIAKLKPFYDYEQSDISLLKSSVPKEADPGGRQDGFRRALDTA